MVFKKIQNLSWKLTLKLQKSKVYVVTLPTNQRNKKQIALYNKQNLRSLIKSKRDLLLMLDSQSM